MIHVPLLRWGEPYTSLDTDKVVHFDTGEPVAEVSQAVAGMVRRDLRKAQAARDALREIPCTELVKMIQKAGELFMTAELPVGDDAANARRLRASTVLDDGSAVPHVPQEHGQDRLRAQPNGPHSRRPHARPRPEHPHRRARRRRRRPHSELPSPDAGSRDGAAEQLAGCPYLVDARYPDADRAGAQTRPARALDALSHGAGDDAGGGSAASDRALPGRRRHRRGRARKLPADDALRQPSHGRPTRRQSARAGPRPRL